jgi:hypothetical protein
MIDLFQQRDFGNKINVTFQYISQNFRSLGLALLYIVGSLALVAGIASGIMQSNILSLADQSQDNSDPMAAFQMFRTIFSPAFWVTILFAVLSSLAVSLVTYAHMKIYARRNSQQGLAQFTTSPDISVAEVWEEVQPIIGRALIITILSSIIAGVASIFLVIPGIYVAIVLSLGIVVTTFEGTDFGGTWNRCFFLIRDKWWSTFGLIFVMGIISGIIGLLFSIPAGIISFLTTSKLLPVSSFWLVLGSVISTVGSTLLRSLIYIAMGFQYTNLVELKEGRGLLSAIDSIGTPPTRPRPTDEGEY